MNTEISVSTAYLQRIFGEFKSLEMAVENGFDGVDFNLDGYERGNGIYALPEDDLCGYFVKLRERADELGIKIFQTHGRMPGYTDDEDKNLQLLRNAELDFKVSGILGSKYCVVHSVTTIFMGYDTPPNRMFELNNRMYTEMLPYADRYGVTVAYETFGGVDFKGVRSNDFFADPANLIKSMDSLGKGRTVLCFDSGHTNVASGYGFPSPEEFVRLYADRIKLLHLHDNDGRYDQHLIPLSGCIKWGALIENLRAGGYDGPYNFEVALGRYGKNAAPDCLRLLSDVAHSLVSV